MCRRGIRIDGQLAKTDNQLQDNCYFNEYVIQAPKGTLVTITDSSTVDRSVSDCRFSEREAMG